MRLETATSLYVSVTVEIWPLLTCLIASFNVSLPHRGSITVSSETFPASRGSFPDVRWREKRDLCHRPFCRYGGHFDFYCFEKHYGMPRGQINMYLPPEHPIIVNCNNRNQNGRRICKTVYGSKMALLSMLRGLATKPSRDVCSK